MKKVFLVFIIAISIVISVLFVINNSGSTKTINIDYVGMNINPQEKVSESELLVVNSCYDYLQKYYQSSLPVTTKEIEQIYNDLNIVLNNDVFFKGFSKSKFQTCLENDVEYCENDGIYEEEYIKLLYYTRLVSVKLKTQLLLGDYQSFSNDFINNFAVFVFFNINFSDVILQDSNFEEKQVLISNICDAYDLMIQSTEDATELALIYQSALKLNATKSNDERIEKYSNKFFEYSKYLPEKLMDYRFENPILNPYEICFVLS